MPPRIPSITLRAGHVQPVWAGHPWIYRQAIAAIEGSPAAGDEVVVCDARGNRLGRGFYSPQSAIPVKLGTRDPDEELGQVWLARRIEAAVERRQRVGLPSEATSAFRLVNSEGDGLPGLTVDRYGDVAVVQLSTVGLERRAELVAAALVELAGVHTVVSVDVGATARAEGLVAGGRVLVGEAADELMVRERGLEWSIPFGGGQKTGFYTDQRLNREHVEALAAGRRVLDLYCYVGGFALAARRGGATEVIAVDSSAPALEIGQAAASSAGLTDITWRRGDVRRVLEELATNNERFDLVILDPPKLARGARDLDKALGHYAELNRLALGVLSEAGTLISCSCSGAVTPERFLRMLGRAGADAGTALTLLGLGGAGPDHPAPPAFAEGRYLKVATLERL